MDTLINEDVRRILQTFSKIQGRKIADLFVPLFAEWLAKEGYLKKPIGQLLLTIKRVLIMQKFEELSVRKLKNGLVEGDEKIKELEVLPGDDVDVMFRKACQLYHSLDGKEPVCFHLNDFRIISFLASLSVRIAVSE